jgi:hypothetical protein
MTQTGLGFDFDYLAAGAFSLLSQAGDVADDALKQLQAGTYDGAAWSKSMVTLSNITFGSYLDCVQKLFGTVFEGPFHSADITVKADKDFARELTVTGSLTRIGLPKQVIPDYLVSFSPAVLPAGADTFQVCVANVTFVGANYSAKIGLRKLGIAATPPVNEDILVTVPL